MIPARDAGGAATEARIRDCLDAVLQQTQGAGPAVSHVTLPVGIMDDVARVLEAVLAQRAARPGEVEAELQRAINLANDAAHAERARFQRLLIAFHDATRRPLGVTPASGDEFYDPALAAMAELRRPMVGSEPERRERPKVRQLEQRLAASERALAGARAVLRQVEWSAISRHAGFAPSPACPRCGGIVGPEGAFSGVVGHAPDCALAAELAAELTAATNENQDQAQPRAADPGPVPAADTGGGHGG